MVEVEQKLIGHHRWMGLYSGDRDEPFFKILGDGVLIVPLSADGEVLFIIEPAVPDRRPILSLPAGTAEGKESAARSANRELQEEIGLKGQRMDYLGELRPYARHSIGTNFAFLARDLVANKLEGDESYEIEIERYPLADFEQLIHSGRLNDSSVIAALFLARSLLECEKQVLT